MPGAGDRCRMLIPDAALLSV
ncbi:hypothetical protein CGLO_13506 [Colletotrichum gloeosporioides Cg-14]|uniref:Uncharacterized protein n=1 Tax=Colletotrichum gloeosporioides (strain Cg-14) TaxID=1237896 RepID=T0K634_COLGC|nr:hypothetical protein CGLO_13506 [Colletotrichum gloeosporioides Cg-14]